MPYIASSFKVNVVFSLENLAGEELRLNCRAGQGSESFINLDGSLFCRMILALSFFFLGI